MLENVDNAMLDILKKIQADVSDVKGRMDKLEMLVKEQGRDSAAMLVMMRSTVGTYDERIKLIEEDVRLLMERG
jgi:hypothetical protein